MIRDIVPRGLLIKDAVQREVYRLRELAKSQGYTITPEPLSNLFAKRVEVTVEKVINQEDPLRARVISRVAGQWRPEALDMFGKLDAQQIPYREYMGRSGAPYFQLPVKKMAKLHRYMHEAVNQSHYLWLQPWWKEEGIPKFQHMLREYQAQSLINIDKIIADPESAIGDKPEDTGTGWHAPISNRRELGRNIERASVYMRSTIDEYYNDMVQAIGQWPENDVRIQLGVGYKAITGGVRSDVDVTAWTRDYQELESSAREVGNDPSSAVHNKVLDDVGFRKGVWSHSVSEYHMDISDVQSYEIIRSTPPATIGGDEDELRLVSADFGWTDTMPKLTTRGIIPNEENIGFGADNISLLGIMLNTAENVPVIMMKSGAPFTMMHYNIVVGQAIAYWARKLQLHLKFLQIGDDLHIVMPLHEIPLLFEAMGHSLRLKGMVHTEQGDSVFVLGKWIHWKGKENMTAFITPRYLKSLTSAKRKEAGTLPANVAVGETYITENTNQEIEDQIQQIWKMYSDLIYFSGTPMEYKERIGKLMVGEGYKQLAAAGVMDWLKEEGIDETFGQATIPISTVAIMPGLDTGISKPMVAEVPIVIDRATEPLPTKKVKIGESGVTEGQKIEVQEYRKATPTATIPEISDKLMIEEEVVRKILENPVSIVKEQTKPEEKQWTSEPSTLKQ